MLEAPNSVADSEAKLKRMLEEEGLDDVNELSQKIVKKSVDLQKLKDASKEKTRPAKDLIDEINRLNEIQEINTQLQGAKNLQKLQTPSLSNNPSQPVLLTKGAFSQSLPTNGTPFQLSSEEELSLAKSRFNNLSSIPDCAEKHAIQLSALLCFKHNGLEKHGDVSVTSAIEDEIKKLQDCLKAESLFSKNLENVLSETHRQMKVNDYKSANEKLVSLLKEIRPFDIREFQVLVSKARAASDSVKGQDILLLLGRTGAGKSTTIHFLAGSKMERKKVDGLDHIAPITVKNMLLNDITTSPHARSETRYIRAIPINFKDVGLDKEGGMICCDTPGFEDTNGPEVDVANGIGVVEAVKQAKSVRPLILFSKMSMGDRGELIKALAHVLVNIVSNIKDHLEAFTYVFTKYSRDELPQICHTLKSIKAHLTADDKSDTAFIALLEAMLEATEDEQLGIDPLGDLPRKLWLKLIKTKAIQHPSEVFQFSIAENSKASLREQVSKHQFSIQNAVKAGNYELALYKFDELKILSTLLKLDFIQHAYDESVNYVQRHLDEHYKTASELLAKSLSDGNKLTVTDMESYISYFNALKNAEKTRLTHLGQKTISSAALVQYAISLATSMTRDLSQYSLDNEVVRFRLDKLKLLSKTFTELTSLYKQQCEFLVETLGLVASAVRETTSSNDYDSAAKAMGVIYKTSKECSDHLDEGRAKELYASLQQNLISNLENIAENAKKLLIKDRRLSKADLEKVSVYILLLEKAKLTHSLTAHVPEQELNKIYHSLHGEVIGYFENISRKIDHLFQTQRENGFDEIELLMGEMDAIHQINGLTSQTSDVYHRTIEALSGFVKELRREAENQVKLFLSGTGDVNYQKLSKSISNLKKAGWLDKYKPGIAEEVFQEIREDLIAIAEKNKQRAVSLNLAIEDSDNIKEVNTIVLRLQEMQPLEDSVSELENVRKLLVNWFEQRMNQNYKLIRASFDRENEELRDLKNTIQELEALKANYINSLQKAQFDANETAITFLGQSGYQDIPSLEQVINKTGVELEELSKDAERANNQSNEKRKQLVGLEAAQKKYNDLVLPKTASARADARLYLDRYGYKSIDDLAGEIEKCRSEMEECKKLSTQKEMRSQELLFTINTLNKIKTHFEGLIRKVSEEGSHSALRLLGQRGYNAESHLDAEIEKKKKELQASNEKKRQNLQTPGELVFPVPESFEDFDPERAEIVISFLNVCGALSVARDNCELTKKVFYDQVRSYVEWFQRQLTFHFSELKQLQITEQSYSESVTQHASVFCVKLKQLIELKKKTPMLFSKFPEKILEQFKQFLEEFIVELSEEMMQLQSARNNHGLKMRLSLIRALSRVDYVIDGEKYAGLYTQFRDVFYAEIKGIASVLDLVKGRDYIRVASELGRFSQLDDSVTKNAIAQVVDSLSRDLKNLIEETKFNVITLGKNIDAAIPDKINAVVTNLNKIKEAQTYLATYLQASTTQEITECIDEVKKSISHRVIRFLDGVEASVDANNFYESDVRMESILQIRQILGGYSTPEIVEKYDSLSDRIKEELDKVVAKYTNIAIRDYPVCPPREIFEKFQQVSGKDQKYTQALAKIRAAVLDKCRKSLEQARICSSIPVEKNPHIREVTVALKFLTDDLRAGLMVELEQAKEDVQALVDEDNEKVNRLVELDDVGGLHQYILSNKSNVISIRHVKEGIIKNIKECKTRIDQKVDEENVEALLPDIKKLCEYKHKLGDSVSLVNNYYEQVISRVSVALVQLLKIITDNVFEGDEGAYTTAGEVPALIEKCLSQLSAYLQFRAELVKETNDDNGELHKLCLAIFPEDFANRLAQMHQRLSEYFVQLHEIHSSGLNAVNCGYLFRSLDRAKRWDSSLRKISRYLSFVGDKDPHISRLEDVLPKIKYTDMTKMARELIQRVTVTIRDVELMGERTVITKNREEFYAEVNAILRFILESRHLKTYLDGRDFDIDKNIKECASAMESKIKFIVTESIKLTTKAHLIKLDYEFFNRCYSNLLGMSKCMAEVLSMININIREALAQLSGKIDEKVNSLEVLVSTTAEISEVANHIIAIKQIAEGVTVFKEKIDTKIDVLLNDFKRKNGGGTALAKLGTILNAEVTGIGQIILAEHKCFIGYSVHLFNEKTQRHGIDYVLANIDGDNLDKIKLRNRYEEFESIYRRLIETFLKDPVDFSRLISALKMCLVRVKISDGVIRWSAAVKDSVPELLAHIFAFWTLKNADHYFDAKGVEDQRSYLLQPHAAQVISIFRMLAVDDTASTLKNNLVQIGTGEGKSVTLAATASLLALLGFDVSCACYSKYLSERDYQEFQSIFESLDVLDHIHYGTFNKLCEAVINEHGNVREIVKSIVSNEPSSAASADKHARPRPKILLIDEVDVFFSKDFYGNVYTPTASLADPSIAALTDLIWRTRDKVNFGAIKRSAEYQTCCARYKNWEFLIEEAVKDMLSDLKSYASHDYIVLNDKIGYKEQDSMTFNMVYGYKTLFAYYHENSLGKISEASLRENISIVVNCGNFSYAEIPHKFLHIMGVTGTLRTLSTPEKNIVQNTYQIRKNTYTPSVFGANNLVFAPNADIKIENHADYLNAIKREIDDRLVGKTPGSKRAVFVFFESKEKLMGFYQSPLLASFRDSYLIMTEEVNHTEKISLIKRATNSGQVTLLTKSFGRGTDFVCRDQVVSANGGTHVIQTFLSAEISEETQIKGRTARQGDHGSYSMVLLENDLERFLIKQEDIEKMKSAAVYYSILNEKRNAYFEQQYGEDTKFILQAKKEHEIAMKFVIALTTNDLVFIKTFLGEHNKGAAVQNRSRTVCLMDATGSMSHLLQKAKNTVGTMFERASEILKEHSIAADSFEMQFAVYRNYDCKEDKLLHVSSWETKPNNLRAFMDTISASGGTWYEEAVEIALWHANEEANNGEVSQVILIGDAPANSQEQVSKGRSKHHSEAYWRTTKFREPTFYQNEVAKLTAKEIPVHAFFVYSGAECMFKEIASKTSGRSEFLDVNSAKGADMLTNLVTEEILRSVGGEGKGTELVDAYRTKFSKAYK
jgi:hypothetical protein